MGCQLAARCSIDDDRVIGLAEGQLNIDIAAGHGEGVVENVDNVAQ